MYIERESEKPRGQEVSQVVSPKRTWPKDGTEPPRRLAARVRQVRKDDGTRAWGARAARHFWRLKSTLHRNVYKRSEVWPNKKSCCKSTLSCPPEEDLTLTDRLGQTGDLRNSGHMAAQQSTPGHDRRKDQRSNRSFELVRAWGAHWSPKSWSMIVQPIGRENPVWPWKNDIAVKTRFGRENACYWPWKTVEWPWKNVKNVKLQMVPGMAVKTGYGFGTWPKVIEKLLNPIYVIDGFPRSRAGRPGGAPDADTCRSVRGGGRGELDSSEEARPQPPTDTPRTSTRKEGDHPAFSKATKAGIVRAQTCVLDALVRLRVRRQKASHTPTARCKEGNEGEMIRSSRNRSARVSGTVRSWQRSGRSKHSISVHGDQGSPCGRPNGAQMGRDETASPKQTHREWLAHWAASNVHTGDGNPKRRKSWTQSAASQESKHLEKSGHRPNG